MLRENLNQSEIISEEGNLEEGNGLSENQSSNSIQKQNQNSKTEQFVAKKSLCLDVAGLLCSSAVGAGVGYLAGGMIKAIVDLAKNGITEVQKKSQEEGLQENTSRYIGINDYTVTGISFGATVGVLTYLCVSELIKQRKEREAELRAVRDNIAENDNFNGALSERQEVRITNHREGGVEIVNGVANGDHQMRLVGAEITVNGDARHDLNRNPRHIMAVGEGDMNNRNVGSIFQLSRSREASNEPPKSLDDLNIANFESLLHKTRENSRKFQERELSPHEESQLEIANNFLKSSGYDNFSKNSPNLVFVMRPPEAGRRAEEVTKEVDDGRGVRQYISNINRVEDVQSLASPRGDVQGSQVEEGGGVASAKSGRFVLSLVKAIEEGKINRRNAR